MDLAIEISQLQFDKVVFVPVVQGVQFHTAGGFMSSTSLSWRKGWFPWSCTLKTTEIPPVAVHVVVEVPVVLLKQVPQVRMVQTVQKCIVSSSSGRCRGLSRQCSKLWWLRSWRLG